MRTFRYRLWTLGIVILALVGLWCWFGGSPEPCYQGKSLHAWFQQYYLTSPEGRFDEVRHQEARRALRALGTNAVPYLRGVCLSKDSSPPWRTNLHKLWNRLPRPFSGPPFVSDLEVRWLAAEAVIRIKPPAEQLLPWATNAWAGTNQLNQSMGLALLGGIGTEAERAAPWLSQALRSAVPGHRYVACNAIAQLGPPVREVLPNLVVLVTNSSTAMSVVLTALTGLGPAAAPALPLLESTFGSRTNQLDRLLLAKAMCKIDTNRIPGVVTCLVNELKQESVRHNRILILSALGELGPAAAMSETVLLKFLDDEDFMTWWTAANALRNMGTSKDKVLTLLRWKLVSRDPVVPPLMVVASRTVPGGAELAYGGGNVAHHEAAELILHYDPTNAEAIAALGRLVQADPQSWSGVFEDLGKRGLVARPALPMLREAARSREKWVREAADKAIQEIEGATPQPAPQSTRKP